MLYLNTKIEEEYIRHIELVPQDNDNHFALSDMRHGRSLSKHSLKTNNRILPWKMTLYLDGSPSRGELRVMSHTDCSLNVCLTLKAQSKDVYQSIKGLGSYLREHSSFENMAQKIQGNTTPVSLYAYIIVPQHDRGLDNG